MTQPTPSNILVILIAGDSFLWPNMEVEELLYTGESAGYEQEAGMLEDAIAPVFQPKEPGTYLLYGFTAHYHKDYEGEVDADYELEGWRKAEPDDHAQFYVECGENEHN